MRVGLVACAKRKLRVAAPARELYTSDLFRKARDYCEREYDAWYVLSARHGVLHPDQMVEPYDLTLGGMGRQERRWWGRRVVGRLCELHPPATGPAWYLHAGVLYREYLYQGPLLDAAIEGRIDAPLEGLGIGRQLRWYRERALAAAEAA